MSRTLLRVAAGFTALFGIGHGFGATHPMREGARGAVVLAMQNVSFEIFGSTRTYWDFYEGYGYTLIAVAFFLAALLWLLSLRPIAQVRDIAFLTAAVQLAIAVLAFNYFFWAPGAFNTIAAGCTLVAAALPWSGAASLR
jgi:hypothetical protein